ncbi:synaptic glycoprotein sc2, putative [Perkinsus marinus ATCC 50983]|uniref:Synaptic glycoprotein sc2, putative n=1 Tax=Perkinsus marinus (strain ATCC 50983 / TXsc) TaxID=423536 RepID=C5LB70_PERM5|nr:synaptic glycoprotein sc2, putative [Perkinsus marinus ATCC 50983]EER05998.1 synaptic glycoprotein sc2, putative [Perkinsus marinus ATCC 50983]|eukprot:XP_002774182.1 synaptic glycoprotein sc2, putative [Perkinsus marinus ATCC 50983]
MKVTVQNRRGKELAVITVSGDAATVAELKQGIESAIKTSEARQRLTLPLSADSAKKGSKPVALTDDSATLSSYGLADGDVIVFKDLGPQISWRLVFFIEYFGPMVIFPILYYGQKHVYGAVSPGGHPSFQEALRHFVAAPTVSVREAQLVASVCWFLHFLKREYETLFVHRFSNGTMPIRNLFKNCAYYWGFALLVGYFVCHPLYTPAAQQWQRILGLAIFAVCEISNYRCHAILRDLRPKGSRVRKVPHGFAFELVSCPNYMFEILSWFGFNMMTQTVMGIAYMLAGAGQMWVWALKKHRNYRREFDGKDGRELYPKNRKILIPYLL